MRYLIDSNILLFYTTDQEQLTDEVSFLIKGDGMPRNNRHPIQTSFNCF